MVKAFAHDAFNCRKDGQDDSLTQHYLSLCRLYPSSQSVLPGHRFDGLDSVAVCSVFTSGATFTLRKCQCLGDSTRANLVRLLGAVLFGSVRRPRCHRYATRGCYCQVYPIAHHLLGIMFHHHGPSSSRARHTLHPTEEGTHRMTQRSSSCYCFEDLGHLCLCNSFGRSWSGGEMVRLELTTCVMDVLIDQAESMWTLDGSVHFGADRALPTADGNRCYELQPSLR